MESQFIFILILLVTLVILKLFVHKLKFSTGCDFTPEGFRGGGGGGGGRGAGGMSRGSGFSGGFGGNQFGGVGQQDQMGSIGPMSQRGGMNTLTQPNRNLNSNLNSNTNNYTDYGNYDDVPTDDIPNISPNYILPSSNSNSNSNQSQPQPLLTPEMKEKMFQLIQQRIQQN
jgi:hypothetical protein